MTTSELVKYVAAVGAFGAAVLSLTLWWLFRQRKRKKLRETWKNQPADAIRQDFLAFAAAVLNPIKIAIRRYTDAANLAQERKAEARRAADRRNPRIGLFKQVVLPVLAGLWLIVFGLQVILDLQIFHGLYPKNPVLAGVIGTTAAVVVSGVALWWTVLLDGHRRPEINNGTIEESREEPPSTERRVVIAIVGGTLLLILVGVLVAIAPARSRSSNLGQDVTNAEKRYDNVKSLFAAGGTDQVAVDVALADLTAARRKLDAAENIDRSLAVIVPIAEIVLSFPAVQASELLLFYLALLKVRRLDREAVRNRQNATEAEGSIDGEIDRWRGRVAKFLLNFGIPGLYLVEFEKTDDYLRFRRAAPPTGMYVDPHDSLGDQPTMVLPRPVQPYRASIARAVVPVQAPIINGEFDTRDEPDDSDQWDKN